MATLADNIGQLMVLGFEGLAPPPHVLEWLARGRAGGITLFARNIESPAQVKRLIAECRAAAKQPILVGIDQEGGTVARGCARASRKAREPWLWARVATVSWRKTSPI